MADAKKKDELDYHEQRLEDLKAVHEEELEAFKARQDRALALASVPQKVVDGNEAAALATITGQKPVRDESDAPPPNELGPHHSGDDSAESEKVDAEVKGDKADPKAKG
jgi:hypothetical protein